MNVLQLIDVLQGIANKETVDVYFSYDSRVCVPYVNVVDFVDDGAAQDHRVNASMFMKGYKEPEPRKAIILRSEDRQEYEYMSPSLSEEEFREKMIKEAWDENDKWSRVSWYRNNDHWCLTEDEIKKKVEEDIETAMIYYRENKEETKNTTNLFFEDC
jgi:hypothetical protein